jgi:hypothetical protein
MKPARIADTTTNCAVSVAVDGNKSDGAATSPATRMARKSALVICEITARFPSNWTSAVLCHALVPT